MFDSQRLAAEVDYGNMVGYFVRIDVELPSSAVEPRETSGGPVAGWLALTPAEAELFAEQLAQRAQLARAQNNERPTGAAPE